MHNTAVVAALVGGDLRLFIEDNDVHAAKSTCRRQVGTEPDEASSHDGGLTCTSGHALIGFEMAIRRGTGYSGGFGLVALVMFTLLVIAHRPNPR
jgi:hypothetical protein